MLLSAIGLLEAEVDRLAKAQPGTPLFALRQAKSLGLSMLKRAHQLGIEDAGALDLWRQDLRKQLVGLTEPEDAGKV